MKFGKAIIGWARGPLIFRGAFALALIFALTGCCGFQLGKPEAGIRSQMKYARR